MNKVSFAFAKVFKSWRAIPLMWAAAILFATPALADDAAERAREEMQQQLNKEVMAKPFNPGDVDKARAYAEGARQQNVTPAAQPPAYWVPGWTCANLTTYHHYSYGDYQNCIYHHRYYGRYWR